MASLIVKTGVMNNSVSHLFVVDLLNTFIIKLHQFRMFFGSKKKRIYLDGLKNKNL